VAVVLLNSNFDRLSASEAQAQQAWYTRTMDSLDEDGSIRAAIVCCHHSPYTNSTVVGSSMSVRQNFLPSFAASRKAQLFLSGHAHAFEHFRRGGKDYIVIGGGGGLLHPLNEGADRVEGDLAPVPRPRFHYIEIDRIGALLKVTVQALQDDYQAVQSLPCPLAGNDQ